MFNERDNPAIYTLGAEPKENFHIEGFFDEENNKLFDLLRNPTHIRSMGWDMRTLDYPKIKNGDCWEVKNGDRKTARLYEDGVLIALADADDSFLGWGKEHEQFILQPKINNIALVEYTFEFVELYRNMISSLSNAVTNITFTVSLLQVKSSSSKRLLLNGYENGDIFGQFEDLIEISDDLTKTVEVTIANNNYDSPRVTFQILSALYTRIGIPENKMPYVKVGEDGKKRIDIEKIIRTK